MVSIVVMGVAGCGKTSFGAVLADALCLPMIEGDAFHPAANVAKMRAGLALDDADRSGWLATLGSELQRYPGGAVLACSALKRSYRDQLRAAVPGLRFVHLVVTPEIAQHRVATRTDGHYFRATLVRSQFDALEAPDAESRVLALDGTEPLASLTRQALGWIQRSSQ